MKGKSVSDLLALKNRYHIILFCTNNFLHIHKPDANLHINIDGLTLDYGWPAVFLPTFLSVQK